jgi:hypothetical protein
MPPPLSVMSSIDKEQVRMLVTEIGYQAASERLGIKYATLRKWAQRGNWNKPVPHAQAIVTAVTKPADVLAQALADDNQATKLGLSRAARKAAQKLAQYPGEKVIGKAKQLRDIAGAASTVHGWDSANSRTNVFANQAVVIDDATIDELQARLKRLRGEA